VGPEHSYYKEAGRFESVAVTDDEALDGFQALARLEGIMPALESAHAIAHAMKLARTLDKDRIIVVGLSGRGDKDVQVVAGALSGRDRDSRTPRPYATVSFGQPGAWIRPDRDSLPPGGNRL
jgi:tryptophan synthase beta chain